MGYLGTKPSNSPLTSELIPNSIITNAKINDVAATKLTGQVPDANAPSGSVIQVVQGTLAAGSWSTTSTSNVSTGLSASITPVSSSNKILIVFSGRLDTQASNVAGALSFFKNSSLLVSEVANQYTASGGYTNTTLSFTYLDSPSTTSSTAYQIYGRVGYGSGTISQSGLWAITLMEIAA